MADNIEPTNIEEHHTWAEVGGLEADYFTGDYPESTGHRGVSAGLVPDQAAPPRCLPVPMRAHGCNTSSTRASTTF